MSQPSQNSGVRSQESEALDQRLPQKAERSEPTSSSAAAKATCAAEPVVSGAVEADNTQSCPVASDTTSRSSNVSQSVSTGGLLWLGWELALWSFLSFALFARLTNTFTSGGDASSTSAMPEAHAGGSWIWMIPFMIWVLGLRSASAEYVLRLELDKLARAGVRLEVAS